MRSASGSRASRVCMRLLMNGTEFFPRRCQRFANPFWRGTTSNIVNGKNILKLHEFVKIIAEMGINIPQLLNREALQFALLVKRQPHSLPDLLVRNPKRHALARQIRGSSKGIHVTGGSGAL